MRASDRHIPAGPGGPSPQDIVHFRPRRKRQKPGGPAVSLNLVPMTDVCFLLLIFFFLSTRFEKAEGLLPSRLPQQGTGSVPLPLSPIVVRIASAGERGEGYALRLDNTAHIPADFNELAGVLSEIQQRPGFDADTPVVIMSDAQVRWDHVVNCWNAAVRVKYKNVLFGQAGPES